MIAATPIRLPKRLPGRELFARRPRVERSAFGIARTWVARDRRYQIVCRQVLYGSLKSHYPPRWYAEERWHRNPQAPIWCRIPGCPWNGFAGPGPAFAAVKKAVDGEAAIRKTKEPKEASD